MSFARTFPGFKLRLTRWGGVFLVAALVLGFAAVNTSNNALMALLGVALASYVVSGAWSRQVLARATVRVTRPRQVFAGRPALVEVELSNSSRVFPAYGLVLRDGEGRALLFDPVLPPRSGRRYTVETVFEHRGWADLGSWRLEVLLPLGFFLKSKEQLRQERVLVYPRLLPRAAAGTSRGGGRRSSHSFMARGREGEVTQLRDFREGDERRQIHWKQSARQQRLIAVDRERQAEEPVFLALDPRVQDPEDTRQRERFEHLVSEVATAVVDRLRRGMSVGLVVGAEVVGPVHLASMMGVLLAPLAEVQVQACDGPEPALVRGADTLSYRVGEAP